MRCKMRVMSKTEKPVAFDRPALLRLAADADADPRTVARVLRGEFVRGRAGERVLQLLKARDLLPNSEGAP